MCIYNIYIYIYSRPYPFWLKTPIPYTYRMHDDSDISGDDAVVAVAPVAPLARAARQRALHGNLVLFAVVASATGFWCQAFESRSESDGGLAAGHWWRPTRILRIVNLRYFIESPYTPRLPRNDFRSLSSCSKMIFGDPRLLPK